MKRHPALVPLSHDHRHLLFLCQQMKIDSPQYEGFPLDLPGKLRYISGQMNRLLIPHFEKEENNLFKPLAGLNKELDDLFLSLTEEHVVIIRKFKELINVSTFELVEEAGTLLEKHIRKEERVLFELIQERIPQKVLENIQLSVYDPG